MKKLSLKDFETVVDDFTQKTLHIDRLEICNRLMAVYMEEIGTDSELVRSGDDTINNIQMSDRISVPRYHCHITWKKDHLPVKREYFTVYFRPVRGNESSFNRSLAHFLHFYDNPKGLFRLEQLSFQLQ